jgi:pimeloyl-ACP methyl ester carboxylesterase
MPIAKVRGANINYEVVGDHGPWVALTPGGRGPGANLKYLADRIARSGYRVLLYDRRNTGSSDLLLEGDEAEYEIWADDLYELLKQVGEVPAFIGGSSNGCRVSMFFYLRHPEAVRGLLLWRVTGGEFACNRLADNYYLQYVDAAKKGGMAAVAETEHFQTILALNPANRDVLLNTDVNRFIDTFTRWSRYFSESKDLPMIGATEEQLRNVRVPVAIVPGNDQTHGRHIGERVAKLIPGAELHILMKQDHPDLPLAPNEEFEEIADEHARIYVDLMNRTAAVKA